MKCIYFKGSKAGMRIAMTVWVIFLIVSSLALGFAMKQISPVEFWKHRRCISLSGYLGIPGIPRHHCVINCIERNGCEFMNYNASSRHCQLGTGMCKRIISDNTTELMIFGSMDHFVGFRLIPANQFEDYMGAFSSDSSGGRLAVIINDKYYAPGTLSRSNYFEAPLENAAASGRDVIQSTNQEEIFVVVPEDGYAFYFATLTTGIPGAVVDELALVLGYQIMADGKIAKLYALNVDGSLASYNSVTGNAYRASSGNPLATNSPYYLVANAKLWSPDHSLITFSTPLPDTVMPTLIPAAVEITIQGWF